MNGVMRTAAFSRTGLYRNYLSGNVIMMDELALLGDFVQLPDFLFYRRIDERTGTRFLPANILRRYNDLSGQSKAPFIDSGNATLEAPCTAPRRPTLGFSLRVWYVGAPGQWIAQTFKY